MIQEIPADFGSLSAPVRSAVSQVYRHGLSMPKNKVHLLRARHMISKGILAEHDGLYWAFLPLYESYQQWMKSSA